MKRIGAGALALATLVCLVGATPAWAKKNSVLEGMINVNTATVEELKLLPGISEVKALAVVESRSAKPFASREDLVAIKGIGEKLVALWMPYLAFEGKTTLKEVPVQPAGK